MHQRLRPEKEVGRDRPEILGHCPYNFLNIISGLGLELSLVKFISSAKDWERRSTFIPTLIIRITFIAIITILLFLFGNSLLSLLSVTATDFLFIII